jgi:hypothetical protein
MSRGEQTGQANVREAASGLLRGALEQTQVAPLAASLVPLAAVPVTLMDGLAGGPQVVFAQCGWGAGPGCLPHTVTIAWGTGEISDE